MDILKIEHFSGHRKLRTAIVENSMYFSSQFHRKTLEKLLKFPFAWPLRRMNTDINHTPIYSLIKKSREH